MSKETAIASISFLLLWSVEIMASDPRSLLQNDGWLVHSGAVKLNWLDVEVGPFILPVDAITVVALETQPPGNINYDIFKSLNSLTGLIDLSGTIPDLCLEQLNPKAPLQFLIAPKSKLTDQGVLQLEKFPGLEKVDLYGCAVTDESVEVLSSLKYLRYLNVDGTKISQAGVDQLRKKLPLCELSKFDWHF